MENCIMINFNKQLIVATFASLSLFCGLTNVQASKSPTEQPLTEQSEKSKDLDSSLTARFATASLGEFDKSGDDKGPFATASLGEFDESDDDEDPDEDYVLNENELRIFLNAKAFIKDGNRNHKDPRLVITQLSHNFLKKGVTQEQAFKLAYICEYKKKIGQLNSALAHFLANKYFASAMSSPKISDTIKDRIRREHHYAVGYDPETKCQDDFNYYLYLNALKSDYLLPKTVELPDSSQAMDLQAKIEHSWFLLKKYPHTQIAKRLPPSFLRRNVIANIQRIISTNVTKPNFPMFNWYDQLPPGREQGSPRERVLSTLRQKAERMVDVAQRAQSKLETLLSQLAQLEELLDDDEPGAAQTTQTETDRKALLSKIEAAKTAQSKTDLKALLPRLSEGWFTMELRHAYHKRHGQFIDGIDIKTIMEQINNPEEDPDTIQIMHMDFAMQPNGIIDGIIECLIIRDESKPIRSLCLSHLQLTGPMPSKIGKLVNLELLCLNGNRLTGDLPSDIDKLVNLKLLKLQNSGLDTASEASRHAIDQLKKQSHNLIVTVML